jgi:hypothetical protein
MIFNEPLAVLVQNVVIIILWVSTLISVILSRQYMILLYMIKLLMGSITTSIWIRLLIHKCLPQGTWDSFCIQKTALEGGGCGVPMKVMTIRMLLGVVSSNSIQKVLV